MFLDILQMYWKWNTEKSNQTLFTTSSEYNKCRLYCEMLTYKPLTNSEVQEEENIYQVG